VALRKKHSKPRRKVVLRDPRTLRNNLFSIDIYTTEPIDPEMVESIRENGILVPIVIRQDLTIVSGHRRRQCAIHLGMTLVPVEYEQETDELLVRRKVLDFNLSREKTTEVKAREFTARKKIEAELAERRVQATQAKPGEQVGDKARANLPTPKNPEENGISGRAADIAAKTVGYSRRTAETAEQVVAEIDRLEASGHQEQAAALRVTLNNKSVAAAKKAIKPEPQPSPHDQFIARCDWGLKQGIRGIGELSLEAGRDGSPHDHAKLMKALMVIHHEVEAIMGYYKNQKIREQRKSA
jgi:ParB-like chromosome segregation protein Spo0J